MATIETRSGIITPASYDEAAQTVEAIASTFADVRRHDKQGVYVERLDPAGLEQCSVASAPLLDGHRQASARDVVGSVASHRIENGSLVVSLRLSQAADAAPVITRIREGLLKLSIGYSVQKWTESVENKTRVRTAAAWRIVEISAVPIPADPGTSFRSENMETLTPEQTRAEIRTICRAANMADGDIDALIDGDATVADAKAAAFDALQARSTAPRIRMNGSNDDPAVIATRASDALAFRMGAVVELPEASRDYANMSIRDLAADCLIRSGVSVRGLSSDEIFHRAHTTSDFPLVVSNAAGKSAAAGYQAAESALKALCGRKTLTNFKPATSIRLGEMGRLEPLSESGEFTATSRGENGEEMQLSTFGRRFDVTRQLLINDDLSLLGDITRALGVAAAQTEADKIVELLTGSAKLSDGKPLFHASRSNIGTGVALDAEGGAAAVIAARVSMRKTKGLDGSTIIDAAPKYLVVGPDGEDGAEALLAEIYPAKAEDVSTLSKKLELVVEPRIEGKNWTLLADPARVPVLQIGYLNGNQGVQIQRQEAWNTLGTSYRAFLDFGTGYAGWRGSFSGGVA
ncbi:prohead protease/major capsid protein fusion protein [Agrobacterium pusense]|uniref:prohead protease/major capsid protein fusion protein n=1 Tax=Agrobacterium pusense TaxID=648995 RepID=UPI000D1A7B6B|nr:prohead protease/major capsid protein fusion protein [Agrobacterium pusense]